MHRSGAVTRIAIPKGVPREPTVMVCARLPVSLVEDIDRVAASHHQTRTTVLLHVVRHGVEALVKAEAAKKRR
jgi:hypothetical protein